MDKFLLAFFNGILIGGLYVVVALGMVVIFKATKILSLAHGSLLLFLAYTAWYLTAEQDVPVWAAFILVIFAGMVFGWILNRIFMRPLIGRPIMVGFLVCLMLAMVIRGIVLLLWQGRSGVINALPRGTLTIAGVSLGSGYIVSFVICIGLFLALVVYFRRTRTGLAMRAVSEDHNVSRSLGISAKSIFALSWVIASALAGVCGILLGSLYVVDDTMGNSILVRALPAMLLGGLESIPGALLGGLLIGLLEMLSATYIDPYVSGFRNLLPFILMVLILTIRPSGLFGEKTIERI